VKEAHVIGDFFVFFVALSVSPLAESLPDAAAADQGHANNESQSDTTEDQREQPDGSHC